MRGGRQCGTVVDYFRVDYFFEYKIRLIECMHLMFYTLVF